MKITEVTEIRTILGQMKECADLGYFGTDSQPVCRRRRGCFWNRTGSHDVSVYADWIDEVINAYPEMDGKLGIFCLPWQITSL